MDFFNVITITLLLWATIFAISYLSVRTIRRYVSGRLVWRAFLVAGILFIFRIGLTDDPFAVLATTYLGFAVMIAMGMLALMVAAFMIYHGIRHGDAMMDNDADPVIVRKVTQHVRKERAWCPLCKENTGCRVRRNPVTGMTIHVINGGGRPMKI